MSPALTEYWLAPAGETAGPASELASTMTVLRGLSGASGAATSARAPGATRHAQRDAASPAAAGGARLGLGTGRALSGNTMAICECESFSFVSYCRASPAVNEESGQS